VGDKGIEGAMITANLLAVGKRTTAAHFFDEIERRQSEQNRDQNDCWKKSEPVRLARHPAPLFGI
jgi:hypothetical protein